MIVGIGNEALQFHFLKYINSILGTVYICRGPGSEDMDLWQALRHERGILFHL
jgi:hypothetical protein